MQWIPWQTPLYIGKGEGCRAIHYFLISAIKIVGTRSNRLSEAVTERFERVPTINDLRRNKKGIKIYRQNSSHVKSPTEFLTHIFADNATCNLLGRLYQTWVIQWYSAHMWQKSIEFIQDVTYWTEYITCEKSDRISHTYVCRKYQM